MSVYDIYDNIENITDEHGKLTSCFKFSKRRNGREIVPQQGEGNHCALGMCEGKACGPKSISRCREVGFIKLKEWQCSTLN